jgi:hypothetical protein
MPCLVAIPSEKSLRFSPKISSHRAEIKIVDFFDQAPNAADIPIYPFTASSLGERLIEKDSRPRAIPRALPAIGFQDRRRSAELRRRLLHLWPQARPMDQLREHPQGRQRLKFRPIYGSQVSLATMPRCRRWLSSFRISITPCITASRGKASRRATPSFEQTSGCQSRERSSQILPEQASPRRQSSQMFSSHSLSPPATPIITLCLPSCRPRRVPRR